MARRQEISDEGWALVAGVMPPVPLRGGGRWRSHRQVLNGMLWKLGTGAQ
jgi:transposase